MRSKLCSLCIAVSLAQELYQALCSFIALAFMEEMAKYLAFRQVLKKTDLPVSWLDAVVLMSIVGLSFGFIESILYAIGASIPVVLVRGITVPHDLYDFSLSDEFINLNDNLVFAAVLPALLDIVLIVMLVVFVRKAKKNEMYSAA